MINKIKSIVMKEKTVDSILTTFTKTVKELNDYSVNLAEKTLGLYVEKDKIEKQINANTLEVSRAGTIADKMASLIEG